MAAPPVIVLPDGGWITTTWSYPNGPSSTIISSASQIQIYDDKPELHADATPAHRERCFEIIREFKSRFHPPAMDDLTTDHDDYEVTTVGPHAYVVVQRVGRNVLTVVMAERRPFDDGDDGLPPFSASWRVNNGGLGHVCLLPFVPGHKRSARIELPDTTFTLCDDRWTPVARAGTRGTALDPIVQRVGAWESVHDISGFAFMRHTSSAHASALGAAVPVVVNGKGRVADKTWPILAASQQVVDPMQSLSDLALDSLPAYDALRTAVARSLQWDQFSNLHVWRSASREIVYEACDTFHASDLFRVVWTNFANGETTTLSTVDYDLVRLRHVDAHGEVHDWSSTRTSGWTT